MRTRRATGETQLGARSLDLVRYLPLRAEAEAALGRGEAVRLLARGEGDARVETIVSSTGRGAQCGGTTVFHGEWTGERLLTDAGGHALAADGVCFCRDCEMAGGYCVDDDE